MMMMVMLMVMMVVMMTMSVMMTMMVMVMTMMMMMHPNSNPNPNPTGSIWTEGPLWVEDESTSLGFLLYSVSVIVRISVRASVKVRPLTNFFSNPNHNL
jgi:hypothetical protein